MIWFNKLYNKKVSSTGLAVFRIAFFLNLFFEVLHLFKFRQLYFDTIAFLEPGPINMTFFVLVWLVVLVLIVLGLFVRISTILNYIFCITIFSSFIDFEYHMHYAYVGISFLAILLPLNESFSLQNLIFNRPKANKKVSVLFYYLPIFVGVGFVYFDSVFHKLTSNIWLNGLGVWFPSSLPQITILKDQWVLNQEKFMLFLGYLTFVFEALFIFFFWMKKLRFAIFAIGIGLHLGILLEFPIPNFAFGMMALYILILPIGVFDKLERFMSKYLKRLKSLKKTTILEFNFSNKIVLLAVVIFLILLQINITLQSPFIKPTIDEFIEKMGIEKYYDDLTVTTGTFSTKAFGITKHPVFMDNHFNGYNHIISIWYVDKEGKERLLPLIDDNGMVGSQLRGAIWVNWSYRVNSPEIDSDKLEKGVASYTSFWANKNNIDLVNATFNIKVKKIDLPNWEWEKDYLTKQLNKPWQTAGSVSWKNSTYKLNLIKPIEEF